MKHMFIKSMAIAATLMLAWNCTEDSDESSPNTASNLPEYTVMANSWWINTDLTNFIIQQPNENGVQVVTDSWSNPVGVYDANTGVIYDNQNNVILTNVKLAELPVITPERTVIGLDGSITSIDDKTVIKGPDQAPASDATASTSSSSEAQGNASSSDAAPTSSAPSSSSEMKVTSASKDSVSSSSAKSSSSSAKSSSSSEQKSSSSKEPEAEPIKYIQGGHSGSGWATRYWDCCKPHCSWQQHAGGNLSKQCTNKGRTNDTNWGNGSVCDGGGSAMTCISQIPFTIDGCSDMAFAFAAVPASDGGSCGKCYQLTFDGKGKYKTDANTKALNGKKLIVMTTNVGTDVSQGQFDVMIPGGGVGIFNGCASMGWGNQGAQYGGLLADCEGQSKDLPSKVVTCLKDKCNSVFSNDSEAKKGCLFLAEWMHAAGNPTHKYTEVECPDVLKQKY